ncbi:MAG: hypothetical protein P1V18_01510 [Candidatus Gracilibacteria bacterium]|nr:hypothetical protein [Candidatus Gracilibacteria bacterium]
MPVNGPNIPIRAPENQPKEKTQTEKINEQHQHLVGALEAIKSSKESPENKLSKLKIIYENQLVFELKNTKLDTRQEFTALQRSMEAGVMNRLSNLKAQYDGEPTDDLKRAIELQKEKVAHLKKTKDVSGRISDRRKRILRRLFIHENKQVSAVRDVVKSEIINSIKERVNNTDKEPFKKAVRLMTEKIAELDMKDDTQLIQELYAELYEGETLKKYKEDLDALRKAKEEITEKKQEQAFNLFIEIELQKITKKNTASSLTQKELDQLDFSIELGKDKQQDALRVKLMTSFSKKTKFIYRQFLESQDLLHLAPKEEEDYLKFCTKNQTAVMNVLFQNRILSNQTDHEKKLVTTLEARRKALEKAGSENDTKNIPALKEAVQESESELKEYRESKSDTNSDRQVKLIEEMKDVVQEKRGEAREVELEGQKARVQGHEIEAQEMDEKASVLRAEARLAEDFHEDYELALREQTLPPKGVTFDFITKGLDMMPSFRNMDASSLLVKAPILFMGLSSIAANTFPLGKNIYMQFHKKIIQHLTVNPFKWPSLAGKLAKAAFTVPYGVVTDTLKWTFTEYSAVSAIVLGGGMAALSSSPELRKKVTSALAFGGREVAGMGPVAGLLEQIKDFTHGSAEKIAGKEYMKNTKGMIYEWLWKKPGDFVAKTTPQVRDFLDSWDIKIDEVKEHQQSVLATEKALEERGFSSAKSLTVSYEKYNSFLLHYLPEDADEDYELPIEVLRDMGFFTDADDIGALQNVDFSNTVDTYRAMQLYADRGKAPDVSGVLNKNLEGLEWVKSWFVDPTQVMAQQVFGVRKSDEGISSMTPEFIGKFWNGLTAGDKHPMRYMDRNQIAKSISLQSDRLISEMGKQVVDGEALTVDAFIDQKIEKNLTEESLKNWVKKSTLKEGMELSIYKNMDERFPLVDKNKKPLEESTVKRNTLERKRYLIKARLLMQGTMSMMHLHKENPPKQKAMRSKTKIQPGKKMMDMWKKQKKWLQKTQGETYFSRSNTIAS